MNLQKLHSVIQGLSEEEIQLIRKALTASRDKRSKYVILFDTLLRWEDWSEEKELKFRRKHLPRPDQLYRTKEKVLDRIIHALSVRYQEDGSQIGVIRTAFHLEAFEQGEKLLVSEFKYAQKKGNSLYLMQLYDLLKVLRHEFHLSIKLPASILSTSDLQQGHAFQLELEQMLLHIRSSMSQSALDRRRTARALLSRIDEISQHWIPDPLLLQRARVRAQILAMEYGLARELQHQLVAQLQNAQQSFGFRLREMDLLMHLCYDTGEFEAASMVLKRIFLLEAQTPLERRLQTQTEIRSSIFVSTYNYSLPLISQAWEQLQASKALLPLGMQITLIYSTTVIFFANREYAKAKNALEVLDAYKRPELRPLRWQIAALRALLAYEMGEFELLDSYLRSAERLARASELKFPRLLVSVTKSLYLHGPQNDRLEKFLSTLRTSQLNQDENRAGNYFDLQSYLIGKQTGATMADLSADRQKTTYASFSSDQIA